LPIDVGQARRAREKTVAEEKKPISGSPPGKDLTSKIAAAYRSVPPEQREKTVHGDEDIQNPELDRAFDKMVETYRTRRPERDAAVVPFPRTPALRAEAPEGDSGEGYECQECGHTNPPENQFCGMCGAAKEEAMPLPQRSSAEAESQTAAMAAAESNIKHHHHYYHHHHYRNNPYLLVAIVLLLGLIAWMQWRGYQREMTAPPVLPRSSQPRVQPNAQPARAPAADEAKPVSEVPPPAPASAAAKPAAKAAKAPARRPIVELRPAGAPQISESPPPPAAVTQKLANDFLPRLVPPRTTPPQPPSSASSETRQQ